MEKNSDRRRKANSERGLLQMRSSGGNEKELFQVKEDRRKGKREGKEDMEVIGSKRRKRIDGRGRVMEGSGSDDRGGASEGDSELNRVVEEDKREPLSCKRGKVNGIVEPGQGSPGNCGGGRDSGGDRVGGGGGFGEMKFAGKDTSASLRGQPKVFIYLLISK
ncbi:hypothetical protein Dimus_006653 [Dionaea muscipula]